MGAAWRQASVSPARGLSSSEVALAVGCGEGAENPVAPGALLPHLFCIWGTCACGIVPYLSSLPSLFLLALYPFPVNKGRSGYSLDTVSQLW